MIEILESRIAPALVLSNAGQIGNDPFAEDLVTTDGSGNIIIVGRFTGTIDVDLTSGTSNITTTDPAGDLYIAKYTSDFSLLWVQTWGGTGLESAFAVEGTGSGDVFVTGQFSSSGAGFGGSSGSLSASTPQTFVIKMLSSSGSADTGFSSDGQLAFGNGTNVTAGRALHFDGSNLLVGGEFEGGANGTDISGTLSAVDGVDGYVIQLFSDGSLDFNFAGGGVQVLSTGSSSDSVFRIEQRQGSDYYIGLRSVIPAGSVEAYSIHRFALSGFSSVTSWDGGSVTFSASQLSSPEDADFALDRFGAIIAVRTLNGTGIAALRYDPTTGLQDTTYGNGGVGLILVGAKSVTAVAGDDGTVFVGGATATKNYIARFNDNGDAVKSFGAKGVALFGAPAVPSSGISKLGMTLGESGDLIVRDSYRGNPDFDPTSGVKKLPARTDFLDHPGMTDGILLRFDLDGVTNGQPLVIPAGVNEGGQEMFMIISLSGPGRLEVSESQESLAGDLDSIRIFGTTLASKLTVTLTNADSPRFVGRILTMDPQQHIGSIILSSSVVLGNNIPDANPDLLVTGKINTLTLGGVSTNTLIRLGSELPYNVPNNTTTPDTYNNRPNLTIGNIRGDGVIIDVTGDGVTPGGPGGGGLGNVIIGDWAFPGIIRTTQSIGSFLVQRGNFFGVLEVDKFGLGDNTTANVGSMTVANGNWGSSGSVIEGNVGAFNAQEFLAEAAIQAGSVTSIRTTSGGFNGTLTLTDAQAKGVASLTVAADFTGKIISEAPLKKLNIKGDFKGSLKAPSIAGITALSFDGTTMGDGEGDAERLNITTTAGLLGLITAKSGIIKNFEFNTPANFSGIKVVKSNLLEPTIGIENVTLSAANIGNILVQLTGKSTALNVDLAGIKNSSFTTAGKMGAITVKLAGATASAYGIQNVEVAGNSVGNIFVSVNKGKPLEAGAKGVENFSISSNTTIGAVTVIGNATMPQVSNMNLWAGGKITSVTVKAKTAANAILEDSRVLAGQSLDITGDLDLKTFTKRMAGALLGAVNVGGSITSTLIASGGAVAAVTVGGNLSQSTITAGALLGDSRNVGGGDDTFHQGGQIGAVTVKGNFDRSSVAVGVTAGDSAFGNGDDIKANAVGSLTLVSAIKSLSIGGGVTVLAGAIAGAKSYGIEAAKIGKLTVAKEAFSDFSAPFLLDAGTAGESAEDILVRII